MLTLEKNYFKYKITDQSVLNMIIVSWKTYRHSLKKRLAARGSELAISPEETITDYPKYRAFRVENAWNCMDNSRQPSKWENDIRRAEGMNWFEQAEDQSRWRTLGDAVDEYRMMIKCTYTCSCYGEYIRTKYKY